MLSALLIPILVSQVLTGGWQSYTNTNLVNDIAGSGDTLYLATYGGLQPFRISDTTFLAALTNADGLPANELGCAVTDQEGNVWLGTNGGGLVVFEPQARRFVVYPPDLVPLRISCLARTGDTLLVGSDNGAVLIDTRGSTLDFSDDVVTYFTQNLQSPIVLSVGADRDIWFGTNLGADRVARDGVTITHYPHPLGDSVKAIVNKDDTVFIATEQGVARFDPASQRFATVATFGQNQLVYHMAAFDGRLHVATGSGVLRLNGSGFNNVWGGDCRSFATRTPGGRDERTEDDNLWIGLGSPVTGVVAAGNGLGRLGSSGSQTSFRAPGLASNVVCGLVVDTAGGIYAIHFLTYGGFRQISHLRPDGTWEILNDTTVHAVLAARDSRDRLWFGHWGVFSPSGGLSEFDPATRTWNAVTWSNNPQQVEYRNVISGLGIDRFDTKWVFNQTGEVIAIDSADGQESFRVPGVTPPTGGGYDFAFDRRDRAWFGTTAGLSMIDWAGTLHDHRDDTLRFFSHGLTGNFQSVALDDRGRPWVASSQGAGVLENGSFQTYTAGNSGIGSDYVVRVRVDSWGNIWFLTDKGLSVFDPARGRWFQPDARLVPNLGARATFYTWLELDEPRQRVLVGSQGGISVFTFSVPADSGLDSVKLGPNPFVSGRNNYIRFLDLPKSAHVSIYTLSGELVTQDQVDGDLQVAGHIGDWRARGGRLRNRSGNEIASGLYLAVVTSPKGRRVLRFAVVR